MMERSKPPLHNFRMEGLKWGNQRLLKCRKENPNGENSDLEDHHRKSSSPPSTGPLPPPHHHGFIGQFERCGGSSSSDRKREIDNSFMVWQTASSSRKLRIGDEGIEEFREKLMDDLQMKADKIKDAILREGLVENEEEGEIPPSPPPPPQPAKPPSLPPPVSYTDGVARPWNLRTRRAACKAPMNGGEVAGRSPSNVDVSLTRPNNNNLSPSRNGNGSKSPKSRARTSGEKREREKFSIQLNRSEIETDFMAIAGLRLPRRPRKRPRAVQKIVEKLTPGFWLTEVNADMYKVEDPETGKR